MTFRDQILERLNKLPTVLQQEVLQFIERLATEGSEKAVREPRPAWQEGAQMAAPEGVRGKVRIDILLPDGLASCFSPLSIQEFAASRCLAYNVFEQ